MTDWFTTAPASLQLLAQERLILEVTERVCQALEERGVTRAELARRLGVTAGEISHRLNEGRNLTLRSLADMLHALGYDARLELDDRARASNVPFLRQARSGAKTWPLSDQTAYTKTGQPLTALRGGSAG